MKEIRFHISNLGLFGQMMNFKTSELPKNVRRNMFKKIVLNSKKEGHIVAVHLDEKELNIVLDYLKKQCENNIRTNIKAKKLLFKLSQQLAEAQAV